MSAGGVVQRWITDGGQSVSVILASVPMAGITVLGSATTARVDVVLSGTGVAHELRGNPDAHAFKEVVVRPVRTASPRAR